jgi:mevalonate kinase
MAIDLQMRDSVLLAVGALNNSSIAALSQLQQSINMARDCFAQWALIDSSAQAEMDRLLSQGALAVKPTGSGGGGYLLSLWA